jgi:hypothetical protein
VLRRRTTSRAASCRTCASSTIATTTTCRRTLGGGGRLGVSGPFEAMFGHDVDCRAAVVSVHARLLSAQGYLPIAEPGRGPVTELMIGVRPRRMRIRQRVPLNAGVGSGRTFRR